MLVFNSPNSFNLSTKCTWQGAHAQRGPLAMCSELVVGSFLGNVNRIRTYLLIDLGSDLSKVWCCLGSDLVPVFTQISFQ